MRVCERCARVADAHADLSSRGARARAQQRDAGRAFVLGERIPYVLLPGPATQDEAAEDPLAAAKAGLQGDLQLYWRNKLQRPLAELLKPCLPAADVQARPRGRPGRFGHMSKTECVLGELAGTDLATS